MGGYRYSGKMQETLKKLGYLLISFWQGVNAKQGVLCSCRKKERSCGPEELGALMDFVFGSASEEE